MKNLQYFPYERNQFYQGKLLTQQEFISEQRYMNDKRRLINRFLHGVGVVSGLQLVALDEKNMSLEAGVALDNLGRELVVAKPQVLQLNQIEGFDELKMDVGETRRIYMCMIYDEKDLYPTSAAGNDEIVYEKTMESYRLYLTEEPYSAVGETVSSLCENTVILFDNADIQITATTNTNAISGSELPLAIKVRAKRAIDMEYSFDSFLSCASVDGVDRATCEYTGKLRKIGDIAEEIIQLDIYPLERGNVEIFIPRDKLTIRYENRVIHPVDDITIQIPIIRGNFIDSIEKTFLISK